jgi:hypothetical protein
MHLRPPEFAFFSLSLRVFERHKPTTPTEVSAPSVRKSGLRKSILSFFAKFLCLLAAKIPLLFLRDLAALRETFFKKFSPSSFASSPSQRFASSAALPKIRKSETHSSSFASLRALCGLAVQSF